MVLSYIIIASLADKYPAATNYNHGAAIVQVIFIYVIQMAYGRLSLSFPSHLALRCPSRMFVGPLLTLHLNTQPELWGLQLGL